MRFRKHINRKSVVLAWSLSYLVILIIPFLTAAYVNFKAVDIIEAEVEQSNSFQLAQAGQRIDDVLYSVEQLCTEIALNPRILEVANIRAEMTDSERYSMLKAAQDITLLSVAYSQISNFYVYFTNSDYVLAPQFMSSGEDYYEQMIEGVQSLSFDEWKESLEQVQDWNTKSTVGKNRGGQLRSMIVITKSMPLQSKSDVQANIVVLVDSEDLFENVGAYAEAVQGSFLITDLSQNPLASTAGLNQYTEIRNHDFSGAAGKKSVDSQEGTLIVQHEPSRIFKWNYLFIQPEDVFWSKVNDLRRLIWISMVFCLALSLGLIVYQVRRNYNPLYGLVAMLKKQGDYDADTQDNEYKYLRHVLTNMLEEKNEASRMLEEQRGVMRANFLAGLLKGVRDERISMDALLRYYDVQFQSEAFTVALFYVEDFETLFEEEQDLTALERYKLAQFIVTNITEELISQQGAGYMTEADDMIACIINFPEGQGPEESLRRLRQVLEQAQTFIGDQFDFSFSVAVGGVQQGVAGIAAAGAQAHEAMEYKFVLGSQSLVFYSDLRIPEKSDYYFYPLQVEQRLINCVKAGDYPSAEAILEEIFDENLKRKALSVEIARCMMFNMVSTIMKAISEIQEVSQSSVWVGEDPVETLLGCESIQRMQEEIKRILQQLCEAISAQNQSARANLGKQVTAYIETHYQDVNLSLDAIGAYLGLTAIYTSKLFREQTGESLPDYIARFRIIQAKRVIGERPDITMDELAVEVGYSSTKTFTRAFKKYEGITPGRYKTMRGGK